MYIFEYVINLLQFKNNDRIIIAKLRRTITLIYSLI